MEYGWANPGQGAEVAMKRFGKKLGCEHGKHERSNDPPQAGDRNNGGATPFEPALQMVLHALRARKQADQEINHHEAHQKAENKSECIHMLRIPTGDLIPRV